MPIKKTTKTDSKASKTSEKKVVAKSENKKDSTKKVVVKRRKSDLKPTKASAVAIVSQANRAKKQALIEKVSNSVILRFLYGCGCFFDAHYCFFVYLFIMQ